MADQFQAPDNVDPGIRRMVEALTPEYLRPNTNIVDPNAPPGKIPSVDPMNPAPFLAVDLLGNAAGLGAKAVGAGLKGAIFAGPMAANAPHKAYDLVRSALLNAKREPGVGTVIPDVNDRLVRALWGKHGVSPGFEGGLRHEIQDFGLKIPGFEKTGFTRVRAPLGDIVEHPDLFKAYPQLKDSKLELTREPGAFNGITRNNGELEVQAGDYDQARQVLAHELQHRVQQIERTPPGADHVAIYQQHIPENVRHSISDETHNKAVQQAFDLYKRTSGEVEAVNAQNRMTGHQYMTPPWLTEETTRANQLTPDWWLRGHDVLGYKAQSPSVQAAFKPIPNLLDQPGTNPLTMYRALFGK